MFLGEPNEKSAQLNRSTLYKNFDAVNKQRILLVSIRNDRRYKYFRTTIDKITTGGDFISVVGFILSPNNDLRSILAVLNVELPPLTIKALEDFSIHGENWESDIFDLILRIKSNKVGNCNMALLLNVIIARAGFCPFLFYSFGKWKFPHLMRDILPLSEFSSTYLYSLIKLRKRNIRGGRLISRGAQNSLYLKGDRRLYKIPLNIAAQTFINQQEFLIHEQLQNTKLQIFLPNLYMFDQSSGIIEKEYIEGSTGHQLLTTEFFKSNYMAINQLKIIYSYCSNFTLKFGVHLDLHPNNFVWDKNCCMWKIIDLGPTPRICAEYFPRGSFSKYFKKIWLERHHRMLTKPIRSVNLKDSAYI